MALLMQRDYAKDVNGAFLFVWRDSNQCISLPLIQNSNIQELTLLRKNK